MRASIDHIVIGAGSAGCVLAARLSEDPSCNVLLIEAGGEPDPRLAPVPGAASRMRETNFDWAFATTPQRELFDRRIPFPRGRGLGGTSVLNYMVYIRGNAGDFDGWAQMGNTGWSYDDVLPYFRRAEANATFDDDWHGQDGPLSVETNAMRNPLCDVFLEAAQQMGLPYTPDFNGAQQLGCGPYQATQKNGRRASTVAAYLDPNRARPNLTIVSHAQVTRIILRKGRAVGVEYLAGGRAVQQAFAESEVILSGGSIGSPHIMMLSGLGPAAMLRAQGIEVAADMPDVGQHLEDHLGDGGVAAVLHDPGALFPPVPRGFDAALEMFEQTGSGPLASYHLDVGAFFSCDPGADWPQSQMVLAPGNSEFFRVDGQLTCDAFATIGWPCKSRSRGSVSLASGNALDAPVIDPNYLSDPDDLRLSIAQLKWQIDLLRTPAFAAICAAPDLASLDSDAALGDHVRRTASTIWHPTGTCRMGPGEGAVVDPDLRVKGIEGLRICDASVMPSIVSGNTNAATIMIAEKGADLIRGAVRG